MKVSIGQRFTFENTVYLLAVISAYTVMLIDIEDGCRWEDGVRVATTDSITPDEWQQITGGDTFTREDGSQVFEPELETK